MSSGISPKYRVEAIDAQEHVIASISIGVPWASGWPDDIMQMVSAYHQTPTISDDLRLRVEEIARSLIPADQVRPKRYVDAIGRALRFADCLVAWWIGIWNDGATA